MRRSRIGVIVAAIAAVVPVAAAVAATAQQPQPAKKGYVLVQADISDSARYAEYAKLAPGIVAKYGGKYLARAGRTATLEGAPARSRVVLLEFPTFEQAQAFYNSPEYESARKLRAGAATAQFVLVEGM